MIDTANLFLEAAKCGAVLEVQRLLNDNTHDDNDVFSALMRAAECGHLECVALLVSPSKYLNNEALCAAARLGHANCVEYLIPISLPHDRQNLALREACSKGYLECVKLLIPVSNFSEHMDPSAALAACVVGGHQDCMEVLYDWCDAEHELNNMKNRYTEEVWGMLERYHHHQLNQQQKNILMGHISHSIVQRLRKM